MTLSDGQLVLSLLKLARGRLEEAVTQPATSGHGLFPKTGSSSLGLSPQASGILGSFYSPPDLHQQVSLAILWTSNLMLKHRQPIRKNGKYKGLEDRAGGTYCVPGIPTECLGCKRLSPS